MKFRGIILDDDNLKWDNYNNLYNHNFGMFGNIRISNSLLKSYCQLLIFFPLNDKQEKTFFNLNKNQKVSYLFKYLIKVLRKNNFNKYQINYLYRLKEKYDLSVKMKMSENQRRDKLKIYFISKDYNSIINQYFKDDKIQNDYKLLSFFTKLMIKSLTNQYLDRIRFNAEKERKAIIDVETTTNEFGGFVNELEIQEQSNREYKYDKIKADWVSVADDISEIEFFIENEVNSRLKKMMYNSTISGIKKTKKSISDYGTSGSIHGTTRGTVGDAGEPVEVGITAEQEIVTQEVPNRRGRQRGIVAEETTTLREAILIETLTNIYTGR